MARLFLMDLRLAGALVVALATLVASDDVIPTECPEADIGNNTVQLAHETDCTKYYGCSGGLKFEMQCPIMDADDNRLYFNPVLQVCDWPENVDCKLSLPIADEIQSKAEIPTECPKVDPAEPVHLAHENDCTKFYKCNKGKKYVMDCPVYNAEGDRLYFNASLQVCDWPENVDCKLSLPIADEIQSKAEIPTECPKVDPAEPVHLVHENDCTKFYKCSKGKKYVMDCPVYNVEGDRLYFNASLQVCDWPENVDCKLSLPITDEIQSKAEIPTECPKVDPAEPVHLAHENDCTKFYKCSKGKKYVMDCPVYNVEGDRLYFNASLQVCDWPWNVNCTNSPTTPTTPSTADPGTPSSSPTTPSTADPGTSSSSPTTSSTADPATSSSSPTTSSTADPGTSSSSPTTSSTADPGTSSSSPTTSSSADPGTSSSSPTTSSTANPGTSSSSPTTSSTANPGSLTTPSPADCIGSCPHEDPISDGIYLANKDCHKYCQCSNGIAHVQTCPAKLHYNPTKRVCDQPINAKCANGKYAPKFQATNKHDEAIMNILGFNERFRW